MKDRLAERFTSRLYTEAVAVPGTEYKEYVNIITIELS